MTKPRNMTPDQEAAWKERERRKQAAFREKHDVLKRQAEWRAKRLADPDIAARQRIKNTEKSRQQLKDPLFRARVNERQKNYYNAKRINEHYEQFMAALEAEDASCHDI